jgi:hypothetical protein
VSSLIAALSFSSLKALTIKAENIECLTVGHQIDSHYVADLLGPKSQQIRQYVAYQQYWQEVILFEILPGCFLCNNPQLASFPPDVVFKYIICYHEEQQHEYRH